MWFDNWTNTGPLFTKQSHLQTCHPLSDTASFFNKDGWNYEAMGDTVPDQVVNHIRDNVSYVYCEDKMDRPW